GENLVEERLQRRVRHVLQAQRRLAHLRDARPQRRDVLGAQVRMVREAALQFVDRLRGDAGRQGLSQPLEAVVYSLQPADALFHREAGLRGLLDGAEPGELRQVLVGVVVAQRRWGWHGVTRGLSSSLHEPRALPWAE